MVRYRGNPVRYSSSIRLSVSLWWGNVLVIHIVRLNWKLVSLDIFSRILPFGPEGPKWQDCFDTFCARAQKVQNKGWRSTA